MSVSALRGRLIALTVARIFGIKSKLFLLSDTPTVRCMLNTSPCATRHFLVLDHSKQKVRSDVRSVVPLLSFASYYTTLHKGFAN